MLERRKAWCMTYFFIVDNEGYGYLGVVRPLQAFESLFAISLEVAWERVVRWCGVDLRHGDGVLGCDRGKY
jgi:hypothetical protein